MTLATWNPFREMEYMLDRYNPAGGRTLVNSDQRERADWAPSVDILEGKDDITIKAELPGVEQKDVNVGVDNGVLTLSGEKHVASEDRKSHRRERYYGSFSRRFTLPRGIDTSRIEASYKNGVLNIVIPKSEDTKPKSIEVKTH